MMRCFYGAVFGLVLSLGLALGCDLHTGPDGFAVRPSCIALGYLSALALGATLGAVLLRKPVDRPGSPRGTRGVAGVARAAAFGGAVAAFAMDVARGLPLPWFNLIPLDGGAGPAGELPLVILPLLGAALGGLFTVDGRDA